MVQPAVRIDSAHAALDVARALETPSEIARFESLADVSAVVRAFLATPEWELIRVQIMGDGRTPTGRPASFEDLVRFFRWSADGAFSVGQVPPGARGAYLHAAAEVAAFGRNARRAAPQSPAPQHVPGLGGEPVAVPQPGKVAEQMFGLGFGQALLACQQSRHIAREGWPAGSYVTAQAGYPEGVGINANTARATGMREGAVVAFAPYLMRCSGAAVDGVPVFAPWTPDQGDLFAQDWRILPRPGVTG